MICSRSPAASAEQEKSTASIGEWAFHLRAQCDSQAEPRPNLFNVMLALRQDPRICELFAYDEMLRAPMLLRPTPSVVIQA
jgi:hypothetical protein